MNKQIMAYGAECWAVRKKDENRLPVAGPEMRMLQWIRGNTRKDHLRNQVIHEDAKDCQMSTFLRHKTSQEKVFTWLYRGREEGGVPDEDGSTTPGKIYEKI